MEYVNTTNNIHVYCGSENESTTTISFQSLIYGRKKFPIESTFNREILFMFEMDIESYT